MAVTRPDNRQPDQLRPIRFTPDFQPYAEGSVLVEFGDTKVICSVSVEDRVPGFKRGSGTGWITAEYAMLPRATLTRTSRDRAPSPVGGRTREIERLIGRSLRACADVAHLGERTLSIDCDVLQADGGTRTAAITGAWVALRVACDRLLAAGLITTQPIQRAVAAVSVGIIDGVPLLDLCYEEDFRAEVDFNVVMTDAGEFVEVQGTAENKAFSRHAMNSLLDLATAGITDLFAHQQTALTTWPAR